jgi:hypothetical protein
MDLQHWENIFFFPRTRVRGSEEKARGRRKDLGRKHPKARLVWIYMRSGKICWKNHIFGRNILEKLLYSGEIYSGEIYWKNYYIREKYIGKSFRKLQILYIRARINGSDFLTFLPVAFFCGPPLCSPMRIFRLNVVAPNGFCNSSVFAVSRFSRPSFLRHQHEPSNQS